MKIVVTGGAGFLGKHLCKRLCAEGYKVIIVGPHAPKWPLGKIGFVRATLKKGDVPDVVTECDGIIHLAGANVFRRWTKKYKELILSSRVDTALALYDVLEKASKRPKWFISASAVGWYGDRGEEIVNEESQAGDGFLASVCKEWEGVREKFNTLGMRTVSIRTGTILDRDGGALSRMVPLFQWGLGGRFGKGEQWFPWIHLEDVLQIYLLAVKDERVEGALNAVAPGLVRNEEFVRVLRSVLGRPAVLPIPAPVLKLCFGELSTLFLYSQKVVPQHLEQLGYRFTYPVLESALEALLE